MATKEQLELQAKAKKEEEKRLRNNAGPLGGVANMTRQIFNPAARGSQPQEPTPPPAATPTPQTDQQKFLAKHGVNEFAQGMDPSKYNQNPALRRATIQGNRDTLAERTSPALRGAQQMIPEGKLQRAGQEMLANSQFTNLGNFGTEGGPNIYGRSSTPGGRVDTFVGAGKPATAEETNARNTAYYNNSDPYNLTGQSKTVRPMNNSLRAGQRQFGNQGRGGVKMNELRNINAQANRAFNSALESGMNTKAALRIADNIRAGAGVLTDQDKNEVSRYTSDNSLRGTQYASDTQLVAEGMRQEGYDRRQAASAEAQMAQNIAASQDATFKRNMQMMENVFTDAEGNVDKAGLARNYFAAGGEETFRGLNGTQTKKVMEGAQVTANRLDAVNQYLQEQGVNRRYDNIGDFFAGANLIADPNSGKLKLGKREFTWKDAMAGGIGWTQIFDDGVQLADGTLVPTEIWESAGPMTTQERQALEIIIPEDR